MGKNRAPYNAVVAKNRQDKFHQRSKEWRKTKHARRLAKESAPVAPAAVERGEDEYFQPSYPDTKLRD